MITRKQTRLFWIGGSVLLFTLAVLWVMQAFKESVVYFYSPSELMQKVIAQEPGRVMRVGGLVVEGSIVRVDNEQIRFTITDNAKNLEVIYRGALPTLFREKQGVVAEGYWSPGGPFRASRILAKHDENYMPPEIAKTLKSKGHWHGKQKE